MTTLNPLQIFIDNCQQAGLNLPVLDSTTLAPACSLRINHPDWLAAVTTAHSAGLRFCGFWGQEQANDLEALVCLETGGQYLLLRTDFQPDTALSSIASVYPAANRPERHAADLLGIQFHGQLDSRRWVRHQAWRHDEYPLRSNFPLNLPRESTPADDGYPFVSAQGVGVIEIPVGPVHAGIIEPGHFRFQAVGETILNLEVRLGYVHKGIEKIAIGRDGIGLARLAGRISGDSTVAHTWSACQALESAAMIDIPARALHLRAIMAERERIANHMGDIGGICNDVGFAFAQYQLTRIKEEWLRLNQTIFSHRFMMDQIVPGGVLTDIDDHGIELMRQEITLIGPEVKSLVDRLEDSESLEDRLMTTGRLTPEQASDLSVVGYVGKASGQNFDVRSVAPYAPYDQFSVNVPCYRAGDVAARAKVRAEEIDVSLKLIMMLLDTLPSGVTRSEWSGIVKKNEGIGFVEGWRGEIFTYIRLDDDGKVMRFYPRDPSWLIWPAMELLIQGNIVPDFPVCNKSVNGSYSGQDL